YPTLRGPIPFIGEISGLVVLRSLGSVESSDSDAVGLGTEQRISDGRWVGHALTLDGNLVHGSFFAKH
ncbi:MAG: hypothetical protein OXI74_03190, partial [Rhodospirillaceae bacterium]|nr:hypothetical protein [Rhodospirillaceae bacterium]